MTPDRTGVADDPPTGAPAAPDHGTGADPLTGPFTDPITEAGTPAVDRALQALVVVAVVVGTVGRFWPRGDLWLDEALSVNIGRLPLGELSDALRRDGHPPLYYALLHLWTLAGTGDWWVRALSGAVGLAGLPVAYLAGRRVGHRVAGDALGGRRTGLLALALYAVLPYGVRYGSETRMYALVVVEVLAGYLLVDDLWSGRAQGRRRTLAAVGLGAVTAALLWTHYWSLWLLAVVGLAAVWLAVRGPAGAPRQGARWSVVAMVAGGIAFAPWLPVMLYQSAHTGTPWGKPFRPTTMLVVAVTDFAGGPFAEAQILSYLLVLLVVGALVVRTVGPPRPHLEVGARPLPRVRAEVGVAVGTMAVAWAVATASGGTFASRYAAVVYPLFVLATAAGAALARTPRATAVVLAVVVAASTLATGVEVRSARTQAGAVADAVAADRAARPGSPAVVVACPDQLGPALTRALGSRTGIDSDGSLTDVVPFPAAGDPRFVDWVDYAERNRAASAERFVDTALGDLPPGTTVYLAYNNSYRTFEGRCEQLAAALAATRDRQELEAGDAEEFFEAYGLAAYRPRP